MFPKKKPETELPAAYQLAEYTFERVNALAERVRKLELKTTTGRPAPGAPLPPALHPEAAPGEDILILKDRLSVRSEQLATALAKNGCLERALARAEEDATSRENAAMKAAENNWAVVVEDATTLLTAANYKLDDAHTENAELKRDLAKMAAHAGTMIQELYFVREQAAIWRELYVNLKAARA